MRKPVELEEKCHRKSRVKRVYRQIMLLLFAFVGLKNMSPLCFLKVGVTRGSLLCAQLAEASLDKESLQR